VSKHPKAGDSSAMPSMTLSQLRNTRRLLRWLRAGKTVKLYSRKTLIGWIVPVTEEESRRRSLKKSRP